MGCIYSAYRKGGTWARAIEALEKIKDVPVFVRMQDTVPERNRQLVERGAKPFSVIPGSSLNRQLWTLLEAATKDVESIKMLKSPQLSLLTDIATETTTKDVNNDSPENSFGRIEP